MGGPGGMGFEHGRRRPFPPAPPIGPHRQFLGDYADFWSDDPESDVEVEQATWPELVDQTRLARWCSRYDFDDAEDDDPAGGDICDEPHDAIEEDGI